MLGKFTEVKTDTKSVTVDIETVDPDLKSLGTAWTRNKGCILGIACKIDQEPSEYYPINHVKDNYDIDKVRYYFQNLFNKCYHYRISINMHYGYYDLGWLDHSGFMDIISYSN